MALEDIETSKGIVSTTLRPTSSVLSGNGNTPGPINISSRETTANSPLQLFQWLVGIHTPKAEATKQLDDAKAQAAKVQGDLTQQLADAQAAAAKMQRDLIARIEGLERNSVAKVAAHADAKVDEMLKK